MTPKQNSATLIGKVVRDTGSNRTGKVMDKVGPRYQLRPLSGGREWEADPDNLEVIVPLRCQYIARLKAERKKAEEAGRTAAAFRFTEAISRHMRVMHP
ncbi:hypothetical protein ACFY2W_08335 [Streptomyces sp. NPDC001262]|uniref:hypothetical protein n=1 Tax=Streptomyces sp. NPDC001262 TaxID=3364552 RepID=UPI0036C4E13E